MNLLERRMIEVLKRLRNEFGVFQIKAELEAEGSRINPEMMRLKDVVGAVGLPIILKIGGVEALTDIYDALALGVRGIVAPMVETPYALKKFLELIKNKIAFDNQEDIEFAFNLETITGYQYFTRMLALPDINLISGVTVGRVDLTGSMDLGRDAINTSWQVFEICHDVFTQAKKAGLKTALGGGIEIEALPVIQRLDEAHLIDKFETRKVVFPAAAWQCGEEAILTAVEFELLWLFSKQRYGSRIQAEDKGRIPMLIRRLGEKGQEVAAYAEEIIAKVTR